MVTVGRAHDPRKSPMSKKSIILAATAIVIVAIWYTRDQQHPCRCASMRESPQPLQGAKYEIRYTDNSCEVVSADSYEEAINGSNPLKTIFSVAHK